MVKDDVKRSAQAHKKAVAEFEKAIDKWGKDSPQAKKSGERLRDVARELRKWTRGSIGE